MIHWIHFARFRRALETKGGKHLAARISRLPWIEQVYPCETGLGQAPLDRPFVCNRTNRCDCIGSVPSAYVSLRGTRPATMTDAEDDDPAPDLEDFVGQDTGTTSRRRKRLPTMTTIKVWSFVAVTPLLVGAGHGFA